MSISSIASNSQWFMSVSAGQNSGASMPPGPPPGPPPGDAGGGFVSALANTLSSLGLTGIASGANASSATGSTSTSTVSNSTSSSASSNSPAQALAGFLQSLMAALHAQHQGQAQATAPDSDGDGSAGSGATQAASGRQHRPNLAADVNSLLQQLASSSSSSTSSGSFLGSLQTSYQNLLNALGDSKGGVSLQQFLQTFSSNLAGGSTKGNAVNTAA